MRRYGWHIVLSHDPSLFVRLPAYRGPSSRLGYGSRQEAERRARVLRKAINAAAKSADRRHTLALEAGERDLALAIAATVKLLLSISVDVERG